MAFLDLEDAQRPHPALGDGRPPRRRRDGATCSTLDLGDIVGAAGPPARTRRGELSVAVDEAVLLAKALRPPPDKHAGVRDPEIRHRQRYLELIADPDAREAVRVRARAIAAIRRFLDDRGFVEVETPTLQPVYGGAAARPFVTHHNVLDRDLFLRIATELYLKRLIVGGLERVYELGKDFRNEGVSNKHNPEFTMLETYEAYADYRDVMEMLEQLVAAARDRGDRRHDGALEGRRDRPGAALAARSTSATRCARRAASTCASAPTRPRCARRCAPRGSTRPTACPGGGSWTGC